MYKKRFKRLKKWFIFNFSFYRLLLFCALLLSIPLHLIYIYVGLFCFFRFNPVFSALNLIFSVLIYLVLPSYKVAVSLQHKPIKTYQNATHIRKNWKHVLYYR